MHVLILLLLCLPCYAESVVRLRYERMEGAVTVTGHGTAFSIAKGRLLTAAHNVLDSDGKPYSALYVECDGDWIKARVKSTDTSLDICLLESKADLTPLEFAGLEAGKGSKIQLIGSKRGAPLSKHDGVVDRVFYQGSIRTRMKVEFDHGDSGCPVLLDGKIVGIAVAGEPKDGDIDTKIGLFVPLVAIREFLK